MSRAGSIIESSVPDEFEDEVDTTPREDDDPPPPELDEAATEARARKLGWVPYAEYAGRPDRWRPADEWLERAETMLPIAQAMNRSLETKLDRTLGQVESIQRSYDEQSQVLREMRDIAARADKAGYERAMREINERKVRARAEGDVEAFAQAVEQAEALTGEHLTPAPAPDDPPPARIEPKPTAAPVAPEVTAFWDANPWMKTDPLLRERMFAEDRVLQASNPEMEPLERWAAARAVVVEMNPEKFPNERPRRPAAAPQPRRAPVMPPRPSGARPAVRGDGLSIDSIADPEERAQAREAFVRQQRHMPGYTEREYMTLYNRPHADVLDVQRAEKARDAKRK